MALEQGQGATESLVSPRKSALQGTALLLRDQVALLCSVYPMLLAASFQPQSLIEALLASCFYGWQNFLTDFTDRHF